MVKDKAYIIGVDGGGTKTVVALADLDGKIIRISKAGPSSFVKVGIEKSVLNISQAISKALKFREKYLIASTFIALASVEENPEFKAIIKKKLSLIPEISPIFKAKVVIGSDQIAAFRSGTDQQEGVVLISGTGSVAHGWKKDKQSHASGWGWLADEGSAFWVGQKAFQAVFKEIDGRGEKTLISQLMFKELKTNNPGTIKKRIYLAGNIVRNVSSLSELADEASQKEDKIAVGILKLAAQDLSLTALTVVKRLGFEKRKFPLVLVGGMFKAKVVLQEVKKIIKKKAPLVEFIRPRKDPVLGAVKLAREQII